MTERMKCSGTSRRTGKPCPNWAMDGSDPPLCNAHAGLLNATGTKARQEARVEKPEAAPADHFDPIAIMRELALDKNVPDAVRGRMAESLADWERKRKTSSEGVFDPAERQDLFDWVARSLPREYPEILKDTVLGWASEDASDFEEAFREFAASVGFKLVRLEG